MNYVDIKFCVLEINDFKLFLTTQGLIKFKNYIVDEVETSKECGSDICFKLDFSFKQFDSNNFICLAKFELKRYIKYFLKNIDFINKKEAIAFVENISTSHILFNFKK